MKEVEHVDGVDEMSGINWMGIWMGCWVGWMGCMGWMAMAGRHARVARDARAVAGECRRV